MLCVVNIFLGGVHTKGYQILCVNTLKTEMNIKIQTLLSEINSFGPMLHEH